MDVFKAAKIVVFGVTANIGLSLIILLLFAATLVGQCGWKNKTPVYSQEGVIERI